MPYGPASFASVVMLALLLAGEVAIAGGPEPVEFRDEDITVKAVVYRPEGAGPFPAVVVMHDCSGLTNSSGAVASKYREWAQLLVKDGFIVLFPESYGSRGIGKQCPVRNRPGRPDRDRASDPHPSPTLLLPPHPRPPHPTL